MLTRLYANNFRCLVNFEIRFEELTLLMGPNGGGKSSLLDLLDRIRGLVVENSRVGDVFPWEDHTAWVDSMEQSFELDVRGPAGLYTYTLVVAHAPDLDRRRIERELLTLEGRPLFECSRGDVQLYRDDHSQGPAYPFDWTLSALGPVMPRQDNTSLTWFKYWLRDVSIVSLLPQRMDSTTERETARLDRHAGNFASWYRWISQEHQDKVFTLTGHLRESLPGFHAFKLEQAGTHRLLKVGWKTERNGQPVFFDFSKLSDGQRVLIVLYAMLFGLHGQGRSVFIDEPENYVALAEIQPWLMELRDACGQGLTQVVCISHHPEFIDYLALERGVWIQREALGPARIMDLPGTASPGLKLSEKVARGWQE